MRRRLIKPNRPNPGRVELYHDESLMIDSTTTVQAACGGCHNLSQVHQHDKITSSGGVGIQTPIVSGNAMVSEDGGTTSVSMGNGFIGTVTATHNPWTGPHISVPRSGLTLSGGGGTTTTSAVADNTRVRD